MACKKRFSRLRYFHAEVWPFFFITSNPAKPVRFETKNSSLSAEIAHMSPIVEFYDTNIWVTSASRESKPQGCTKDYAETKGEIIVLKLNGIMLTLVLFANR